MSRHVRQLLRSGETVPARFTRPEIATILEALAERGVVEVVS